MNVPLIEPLEIPLDSCVLIDDKVVIGDGIKIGVLKHSGVD
jgi:hypothetical protein